MFDAQGGGNARAGGPTWLDGNLDGERELQSVVETFEFQSCQSKLQKYTQYLCYARLPHLGNMIP